MARTKDLAGGTSYFPCALAMIVLIAIHWAFSCFARYSSWFSGLIKGHSTCLIADGGSSMMQVAAVTYARNSWGAAAPPVPAGDVQRARADLQPRTDEHVACQARGGQLRALPSMVPTAST